MRENITDIPRLKESTYKERKDILRKEKWLYYLVFTREDNVNVERVEKISEIDRNVILEYVFRTLDILEKEKQNIPDDIYEAIKVVLQWSEVAKCGSVSKRKEWRKKGYQLEMHNLASAEIYKEENETDEIIYTMIKTHGIIGQVIRGEAPMKNNEPLYKLVENDLIAKERLKHMLQILNKCVIGGVSEELYKDKENEIDELIEKIINGNLEEYSLTERLQRLLPELQCPKEKALYEKLLAGREFWYTESALKDFSSDELDVIFSVIANQKDFYRIKYISFYNISRFLYYDYEGKKKINVYKRRVVESFLKDMSKNEHINFDIKIKNDVLLVGFKLTPVCEKLIDFCVEAERSGVLSYEKSIALLFDLFGFRRDEFDRLNNEEKYLETMNKVDNSSKKDIISYVAGDVVVDVGSGGGVMLELLESKYPDKTIIGTDISQNVVEYLQTMKEERGYHYDIIRHNFTEREFDEPKPDTIIFSSILHEIYSYTETNGKRFQLQSVRAALRNAVNGLNPGGRIIIRDGVKTNSNDRVIIHFQKKEGVIFLKNYLHDFEGLQDIKRDVFFRMDGNSVAMDINLAREFLYTYTWGQQSYAHEVKEQFGYMTLEEMNGYLENDLHMKRIVSKEYLENGYKEHLKDLITLCDENDNEIELPNSTMFLVYEKV